MQAAAGTVGANPKYKALLDKFISRLPERVGTMTRLLQEQNLVELERAVHQLKGAGGSFGYPEISRLAATMEAAFKKQQAAQFEAWLAELAALAAGARAGLENAA